MFRSKKIQEVPPPKFKVPTTPTVFPDGSVVTTESGRWYIKGKNRFFIPTDRVFFSWSFPLVINGTDASISKYLRTGTLGFRSGSLLYADGQYYIVSGNVTRKVSDPDVFLTFGLDPRRALWVSDKELALHKAGEVF